MGRTFSLAVLAGIVATILVGLFMAHKAGSDFRDVIGLATCTGIMAVLVGLACVLVVTVFREIAEGYGKIFRRLAKNPRFSLLTLMEFLTVFAVTFSLLRWAGLLGGVRWSDDPVTFCVTLLFQGGVSFVLAIGAVALVHLIIGDVGELFARRRKPSEPNTGDPWDRPDEKNIHPIEPPAELPEAGDTGRDVS